MSKLMGVEQLFEGRHFGAASAAYLGSWTSAAWGANATGVTDTEIKIAGLRLRRVRPGSERWRWPMD
jgi:hypothetical protein